MVAALRCFGVATTSVFGRSSSKLAKHFKSCASGETALHLASRVLSYPNCRELIERGAKQDLRNTEGCIAKDIALEYGVNEMMLKLLENKR